MAGEKVFDIFDVPSKKAAWRGRRLSKDLKR